MDNKEAERLREFREAYKEEFNEDLTEGEASVMLTQLVQLYQLLCRPLPPDASSPNNEGDE